MENKRITIDYMKGFDLPNGRCIVEYDEEERDYEIVQGRRLVRDEILSLDPDRIFLIDNIKAKSLKTLKKRIEEQALVLDYGVCRYFLENPEQIPKNVRERGKAMFIGTVLGWKHPYTRYILEHVVPEIPVLNVHDSGARIDLVNCAYEDKILNTENFPVIAYRR